MIQVVRITDASSVSRALTAYERCRAPVDLPDHGRDEVRSGGFVCAVHKLADTNLNSARRGQEHPGSSAGACSANLR